METTLEDSGSLELVHRHLPGNLKFSIEKIVVSVLLNDLECESMASFWLSSWWWAADPQNSHSARG